MYDPATELYFEVHIEQGPVLEAEGLPLGVVTAIAGQSRFNLVFEGQAGHAGTTPMHLRRDAATAAAEFVLAAERIARAQPGLVATVGELQRPPRRRQRDPRPRRRHARHPPSGRRRARGRGRAAAGRDRGDRRAPRRRGHVVDDLRAARHPLHARAGRARSPRPSRRPASRCASCPAAPGTTR